MSNFVDRLLALVAEQEGGKHTVFAKRAGIQAGTFQNYINGRKPSYDALLNICITFNTNINWLLTGKGPRYIPSSIEGGPCDADPEVAQLLEGARRVLKSGNPIASEALKHNINYFDHAVKTEERLQEVEAKLENIMDLVMNQQGDEQKKQAKQEIKLGKKKDKGRKIP